MIKRVGFILLMVLGCVWQGRAQLLDSLTLDTMTAFTSLEEALKQPDKVIKLVLRKEKLSVFPQEILSFKNLQYLDLSKNRLKEIPEEIDSLKSLQVLILSKNDIETLPKEIGLLKSLRMLNVNQNELVSLPPQIGNLENLQYLDLWSNNISYFPEQMKYLKNLKVMDLRVILINTPDQKKIQEMLPHTRIYFSPSCNCQY